MTFTDGEGRRWRVLHTDQRRDTYTVERDRRFFRGRLRLVSGLYVHMCTRMVNADMRVLGGVR